MSLAKPIFEESGESVEAFSSALKYAGKSIPRFEDLRLTAGEGSFIDEMPTPRNLHHVAIVRSPYPHAKISGIDVREARELEGVRAVLTPEDLSKALDPLPLVIKSPIKYYPFALHKVRYVGEPVVVIVARDRSIAEDAASLVRVEYQPLSAVVDAGIAMREGSPLLHESLGTNVVWRKNFDFGDTDQAFRGADKVVEINLKLGAYTVPPLEPYGLMASYEHSSGILTEWCNFIGPFSLFYVVSRALRLSEDKFRVITPRDNGGSFGTKLAIYPYMALIGAASILSKVPVKWIETRSEHLAASTRAAGRQAKFELALSRDGIFKALRANIVDDIGAYPRSPEPGHILKSLSNFTGPYKIPNVSIEATYVATNTVPTSPIRAFGRPHLYIPLEKVVNKAAEELDLDPMEIRFRNFIPFNEFPFRTVTGGLYDSGDYFGSLTKLGKIFDYDALRKRSEEARTNGHCVGIGIACAIEPSVSNMAYLDVAITKEDRNKPSFLPHSGAQHSAIVKMEPSGAVTVQMDSCPQGQGHETVAAQIAASVLGVKPEEVRVITGVDTQKDPWSIATGTYASRFGSVGISAIYEAAMKVRRKVIAAASQLLSVPPSRLDIGDAGIIFDREDPKRSISVRRVAGTIHWNPTALQKTTGDEGQNLYGESTYNVATLGPAGADDRVNSSATYGIICTAVMLEVIPETGETKILKYASVHDPGNPINPGIIKQLCEGGVNQGVSHALFQELAYSDEGQPVSTNFGDYYVTTAENTVFPIFESAPARSPFTPLGTKGVSEGDNMTAPAAILLAIEDACKQYKISVDELPATPERIWKKLKARISSS